MTYYTILYRFFGINAQKSPNQNRETFPCIHIKKNDACIYSTNELLQA